MAFSMEYLDHCIGQFLVQKRNFSYFAILSHEAPLCEMRIRVPVQSVNKTFSDDPICPALSAWVLITFTSGLMAHGSIGICLHND